MNEKLQEFIRDRGWTLGRAAWRSVTHVFKYDKSLCGIWKRFSIHLIFPGTENPMCKRCMRSLNREYNKS